MKINLQRTNLRKTDSDSIDCYQQSAVGGVTASYNNLFTCPAIVSQCYKYVCVGNVYYIQKGCLDQTSPTQNCQVIDGQCRGQGGTGVCYTCSSNRCNGAVPKGMSLSATTIYLMLALSLFCSVFWMKTGN
uniref:Uncharacterized protein n=1 Tax=Ditylenchus dipsaci TaxID=166011 RepID=A0A915EL46_9BILA